MAGSSEGLSFYSDRYVEVQKSIVMAVSVITYDYRTADIASTIPMTLRLSISIPRGGLDSSVCTMECCRLAHCDFCRLHVLRTFRARLTVDLPACMSRGRLSRISRKKVRV